MRTLLLAGGYPHHLAAAVEHAFAVAGWQVEFFDLSPESPFHRPLVKPVRKLIHNLRICRHPETFDSTIFSNLGWRSRAWLQEVERLKPDAALLLRGNRLALPTLRTAARTGLPIFCWMLEGDTKLPAFLLEVQAGVYRRIFVYAHAYLDELRKAGACGIYYPHRATELPDEARVLNRRRRYAWSFLGGHSPWREQVLAAVLSEFPDGFLVGSRWDRVAAENPSFRAVVHPGYFKQKESMELYLDSRVGLDISAGDEPGTSGIAMRVPELIACGCHVLLQDTPELHHLPYPSSLFTTYRTIDDLLALLRCELKEPAAPLPNVLAQARSVVGFENLVGHVTAAL